VCGAGTCTDTPGSYACTCPAGYAFDGVTCIVTDACVANVDDCTALATCIPSGAMWSCTCPSGYAGNGRTPPPASDTGCTDVNECTAGTPCGVGTCTNTPGSYACTCPSGYLYDGTTCVDVDECAGGAPCGVGTCANLGGTYACTCPAGYAAPATGGSCSDVDECLVASTCSAASGAGSCSNAVPGYDCACNPGYAQTGSGFSLDCVNVDECATGAPCGVGTCADTAGSYTCACPAGYAAPASGGTCDDVDECLDPALCNAALGHGTCVNLPGEFDCDCGLGFEETGSGAARTCVNVDECTLALDDCDTNATCADAVPAFGAPGFVCTCVAGWEGPGNACTDFDECADTATNDCSPLALCLNQTGTYGCECGPGWEGNGFTCADIDDCGTLPCGTNEICINQLGAERLCECEPGAVRETPDGPCESSCGNGVRIVGEECDDGNLDAGDGCDEHCDVELGWVCDEIGGPSTCAFTCGDGVLDPRSGEECDDGTGNSDTEIDACRLRCVRAFCGDGVADTGEACDTGDLRSDRRPDGCRMDCVEAFCGDGVLDTGEYCDEGTGTPLPAGSCTAGCFPDGGPAPDSGLPGVDAGVAIPPVEGGCGCSARTPSAPPLSLLVVAAALLARRRRR
jgi:fibulin 1/2